MGIFSRLLPNRNIQKPLSFAVRNLSRSSRGKLIKTQLNDQTLNQPIKFSWWPVIGQTVFSGAALYAIFIGSICFEVIETKFSKTLSGHRFRFDVYDDWWGQIIKDYLKCPDTLFNRRIVQIMTLCGICIIPSFLIRKSARAAKILASGAHSSFISPFTSMFLHGGFLHLGVNMLGFYIFTVGLQGQGPVVYGSLDRMSHQHLLSFLIMSGVFVSLIGNIRYRILRNPAYSIGFSGAISSLVMFEFAEKPNSRVRLVFMPENSHMSAKDASMMIFGFELILFCLSRYHPIDAFGHLTGLGFGYIYSKYLFKIWEEEKKEVTKELKKEYFSRPR